MQRARWATALIAIALLLLCAQGPARAATAPTPLPVRAASPTPTPTATSTPVAPLTPPKAAVALQRSIAVMQAVHQIHTEATLQGGNPQQGGSNLKISGDCIASVAANRRTGKVGPSSVRAALWTRGQVFQPNKPITQVDDHLIIIGTNASGQTWERSARTHNLWQKAGKPRSVGAIYLAEMCPQFLAAFAVAQPPRHLKNLGLLIIRGATTWRLQSRQIAGEGVVQRVNIYVSVAASLWIRFSIRQTDTTGRTTALESFDYSGFNQPVTIVPPQIGSPTP